MCKHEQFESKVDVTRLQDSKGVIVGYTADLRIYCSQCKVPMQFIGLPVGSSPVAAMCSVDALEARLPICPAGEQPSPLDQITAQTTPRH